MRWWRGREASSGSMPRTFNDLYSPVMAGRQAGPGPNRRTGEMEGGREGEDTNLADADVHIRQRRETFEPHLERSYTVV